MKFASSDRHTSYENFNFFPGPGHYDSKNTIAATKAQPKGHKYAVPKSAFGLGGNRFNGNNKDEIDLGPGYYLGQKEWQFKKTYKEPKAQFYPNPRKIITIPSIPSSTHAMGYVEREDGYLIPLNGSSIKDTNDLGPGAYNVADDLTKKKVHGFNLNKTRSPRFPPEQNKDDQQPRIVLGNYTLPKKEIEVEPETQSKPKAPPKRVRDEAELAKAAQEKIDENPGLNPGYYFNEKLASSFNVQHKPLEYQNFGSTAKRFQGPANASAPGPGCYNVPMPDATRKPYIQVEPYSKGDLRFKSVGADGLPGPGAYNAESNYSSNNEASWASQTNFPSAFGSGASRFIAPKSVTELPGPGSYNPIKGSKKNKKRKNKPAITSLVHGPPREMALLDLSKDLAYASDLDLGGRSKGAVIVKHEDPANKGTSAFQSSQKRFIQEKDHRSLTPGPGTYEWNQGTKVGVKKSFCAVKMTFSLTPRGYENKGDVYKKTLGPGVYDYEVDPIKPKINYATKINPVVPNYGALLPK